MCYKKDLTWEELNDYADEFVKSHGCKPKIIKVNESMRIRNAENTSRFHPWKWGKNGSWIDYWRAFTRTEAPEVCPSISNNIFDLADNAKNATKDGQPEHNLNIIGAHVRIDSDDSIGRDILYIAPICEKCNSKFGELLHLRSGLRLVEMVDSIEDVE